MPASYSPSRGTRVGGSVVYKAWKVRVSTTRQLSLLATLVDANPPQDEVPRVTGAGETGSGDVLQEGSLGQGHLPQVRDNLVGGLFNQRTHHEARPLDDRQTGVLKRT